MYQLLPRHALAFLVSYASVKRQEIGTAFTLLASTIPRIDDVVDERIDRLDRQPHLPPRRRKALGDMPKRFHETQIESRLGKVESFSEWYGLAGFERADVVGEGHLDKGIEGEAEEDLVESDGVATDRRLVEMANEDVEMLVDGGANDGAERAR